MDTLKSHLKKLEPYFFTETMIDININPDGCVFTKDFKEGKKKIGLTFEETERNTIARLIATHNKKYINEMNKSASGVIELNKGEKKVKARVQILIPPIVTGTTICFRMAREKTLTLEDYLNDKLISKEIYEYLINIVKSKKNVIIAGSTGSGKTTLLNALVGHIGEEERIQIIEDTQEVKCNKPNVLPVLTENNYTYNDAVRDAMRCSPERIIVGEVRDGAALELLKAWNTGHSGGFATIHANSAMSVPDRLLDLCNEAVVNASPNLITEAVDLIVYVEMKKGKVILKEIIEPLRVEGKDIVVREINPVENK